MTDEETLRAAIVALEERGDTKTAARLLDPLVQRENADAIYWRSCFSTNAESVEAFESRRIAMLSRAAALGQADAHYQLHIAYQYGDHVEKDWDCAVSHLQTAAELGHAHALYLLGLMYVYGANPFRCNVVKGVALIERAASLGFKYAYGTLAEFYEDGLFGCPQDRTESLRLKALSLAK